MGEAPVQAGGGGARAAASRRWEFVVAHLHRQGQHAFHAAFDPKADVFHSPNGDLKRIEDIKPDANSILGEWSGREWKFEEETSLGKTKENIALGRFAGNKYGIIVYRIQELSSEGTRLLDKSLVLRFPLGKAAPAVAPAPVKEAAPAKAPAKKK